MDSIYIISLLVVYNDLSFVSLNNKLMYLWSQSVEFSRSKVYLL